MQQAASSSLGFAPKRTMRVAQELYEGINRSEGTEGLITYMRTDSVRLSDDAVAAARGQIEALYGKPYLSPKTRTFENKKKAQDAHEAIRPTSIERAPDSIASYLTPDQLKLYRLIYGRFLATQMAAAVYHQRKIVLRAGRYALEATGSSLQFDGFLKALPEQKSKEQQLPDGLEGRAGS